jgi:gas vesicle protein
MKKLLIVLAAGIAVGILLAPEKGSASWKKLVDGLDDIKDKAVDEINSLMKKSKTLIAKTQEKAQEVSQDW